MTVNAGITNRTNLLAENGNLIAALVANPDLLRVVLNEIYDYLDANWNHYNTHRTSAEIDHPDGSVTTRKVADGAIVTVKLGDSAVVTAKIADGAITTIKIADGNVTTSKITDLNVTTAKLADSGVTTQKLADLNVTTSKIADSNVTTGKITDGAVITAKIADNGVTTVKLADGSVTTLKLGDGQVTLAKLAADAKNSANHTYAGNVPNKSTIKDAVDDLYTRLIGAIGANSFSEIVDARVSLPSNKTYTTLKGRLDDEIGNLSKDIQERGINVLCPPAPLVAAKGDANYYNSANNKYYADSNFTVISDDTAVFKAVIARLTSPTIAGDSERGLSILYIPYGKFLINNVDLPNGVTVKGTGYWHTMVLTTGDYAFKLMQPPAIGAGCIIKGINFRTAPVDKYILTINRTSVLVEECWFGNSGISIVGSSEIEVKSCIFDETPKPFFIQNSPNVSIHDNVVFNPSVLGIYAQYATNLSIENNFFSGAKNSVVNFDSCYIASLKGNRFIFSDTYVNSDTVMVRVEGGNDIFIEDNKVLKGSTAARCIQAATSSTINNLTIKNNNMKSMYWGIVVGNKVTGTCIIEDNTVELSQYQSLDVSADNAILEGNKIINGNQTLQTQPGAGATGINIIGNNSIAKDNYVKCTDSKLVNGITAPYGKACKLYHNDTGKDTDYSSGIRVQKYATTMEAKPIINQSNIANSTAPDVATLVSDFNTLLQKLRDAGLINNA